MIRLMISAIWRRTTALSERFWRWSSSPITRRWIRNLTSRNGSRTGIALTIRWAVDFVGPPPPGAYGGAASPSGWRIVSPAPSPGRVSGRPKGTGEVDGLPESEGPEGPAEAPSGEFEEEPLVPGRVLSIFLRSGIAWVSSCRAVAGGGVWRWDPVTAPSAGSSPG